jgi:glycerophosphoryl diester phosphodiesterase
MILVGTTLLVFIVFCIYRKFTWRAVPWPSGAMRPQLFQCHRGFWISGIQENTLEAFREAKAKGYEMVEMDVMLSGDFVPIVFHDEDLTRFTGLPNKVENCLADELYQWVNAPTLEQVLTDKKVPEFLNIELKTNAILGGALEKKVCELILKHNATSRVMFSSFSPFSIWRLSQLLPHVPRALLSTDQVEPGNSFYLRKMWLVPFLKVHAIHLDAKSMTLEKLRNWNRRSIPVALWTVNDREQAKSFLGAGAMSIITDSVMKTDICNESN